MKRNANHSINQPGLTPLLYNFITVAPDDEDLAWLRAHATVPE